MNPKVTDRAAVDRIDMDRSADRLIQMARQALKFAVAPSSGFKVGASLLASDGMIYSGCNIESPVYLGVCAERVALFKALSEGAREFLALAIACEENMPCPPCGTCRQLLWEFAPGIKVVIENPDGVRTVYTVDDLLPFPFQRGGQDPFKTKRGATNLPS